MLRLCARSQMVLMHSDRHSRYRGGIICTHDPAAVSASRTFAATLGAPSYSSVLHGWGRITARELSIRMMQRLADTQYLPRKLHACRAQLLWHSP